MTDYISREAALKDFEASNAHNPNWTPQRVKTLLLLSQPAADVAEVVRCKDCVAWKRNVGIVDSPNGHCFEHDIDTNGQDFCSYGEYQTNTGGVTE
jgi:hypothetical protein